MIKWGATIMRPISKKESYTRDRLIMTYQEVLATYKIGSVKKKKKKIGSVTLTWLQTGYTK